MKTNEHDSIQEKSKDPRVLELFNWIRSNPLPSQLEILFDVAECEVENRDLNELLSNARKHIDALELNLAAISLDKPKNILKVVFAENDLQSCVTGMEVRLKGEKPEINISEAINGWAMMTAHLEDVIVQLAKEKSENAKLSNQLAAAQRGILIAHDIHCVMTNNDPSFQFSSTDPKIKYLADELARIPGLTLDMAVDRWAAFNLIVDELKLELERYKDDSRWKNFAANINAETALDLNGEKVVRYKTESTRGKKGVSGKKYITNEIKDLVFKWCTENRREQIYRNLFSIDIGKLLVKEPDMKARKAETIARFVKGWEKENNFQRG